LFDYHIKLHISIGETLICFFNIYSTIQIRHIQQPLKIQQVYTVYYIAEISTLKRALSYVFEV